MSQKAIKERIKPFHFSTNHSDEWNGCTIDQSGMNQNVLKGLLLQISQMKILKKDNKSLSGYCHEKSSDRLYFVKNYHYGPLSAHMRRIIGFHVKHLFLTHIKLLDRKQPVTFPYAYVYNKDMTQSFFITEFFEGSKDLGFLFRFKKIDNQDPLLLKLPSMIASWHKSGASHGDLKWSNILVTKDSQLKLIDLVQSKVYEKPVPQKIMKDLIRFYRFSIEISEKKWCEDYFIKEYKSCMDSQVIDQLDFDYVKHEAERIWKKKGQKRFEDMPYNLSL